MSERREELHREVREILQRDWDPEGLWLPEELWDLSAAPVVAMLLRNASIVEVTDFLEHEAAKHFRRSWLGRAYHEPIATKLVTLGTGK